MKRFAATYVLSVLIFAHNVHARQDFLSAWKTIYPKSTSSKRNCQLCHQRVDGGDGWNVYGITVRSALLDIYGGIDINAAIIEVELEDADLDTQGLSNLEEIRLGLDPGWKAGNNNDITFKNFDVLQNQAAPFIDVDGAVTGNEELCFPVKTALGGVSLICL